MFVQLFCCIPQRPSISVLYVLIVIAECLSTRLLILQCVFSVGGVWYPSNKVIITAEGSVRLSHTFHTSLHMHDRPSQKHVPRLLIHTCWFKGHEDVREAYSANT